MIFGGSTTFLNGAYILLVTRMTIEATRRRSVRTRRSSDAVAAALSESEKAISLHTRWEVGRYGRFLFQGYYVILGDTAFFFVLVSWRVV